MGYAIVNIIMYNVDLDNIGNQDRIILMQIASAILCMCTCIYNANIL